jgi:hypothetical protein
MATPKKTAGKVAQPAVKTSQKTLNKTLKAKLDSATKVAGSDAPDRSHKFLPSFKKPKSMALAADLLWTKQEERKKAQAIADALEAEEKDLKAWIIDELPKSQASGIAGKLCRVTAVRKEVPQVSDWPKFYAGLVAEYQAHLRRKDGQQDGAFSLLQRRLGDTAVKERWENGHGVEGVGKFTVTSLSINKV